MERIKTNKITDALPKVMALLDGFTHSEITQLIGMIETESSINCKYSKREWDLKYYSLPNRIESK